MADHPEWKILHGHHTTPAHIYLKIAQDMGRVTIAHSHSAGSDENLKSKLKKIIRSSIEKKSDHLFAASVDAAKWMFPKKWEKAIIFNNSINTKEFKYNKDIRNKKRNELGVDGKYVIGHIGRFTKAKNHTFLLEIFSEILKEHYNSRLLIVGTGKLEKDIKQKVIDLKLNNHVIFTGVRSDIPDLMQAMDVFLFPSLHEGLGLVAIEAQAAGLPTIVSNKIPKEAFLTDLIHKNSLNDSPKEWANKVLEYLNQKNRRDRTEEVSRNGFDINENSRWLEKFYNEINNEII